MVIPDWDLTLIKMAKLLHAQEYEHFRSLLAATRAKCKLTQADVSARLGRPQSFVSKYESGERRLDVVEFIQLSMALEVEPQTIICQVQIRMKKRTSEP